MRIFFVSVFAALMTEMAFAETRIGIIGCDTCHAVAFAQLINVEKKDFAEGFRVSAAYQWGSREIASCTNTYKYFMPKIRAMQVEIVSSIQDLLTKCDVVCLETCDGRLHYEQAVEVFKSGKRVFIDKPLAHDFVTAKRIYEEGLKHHACYFSSSALRYADEQQSCACGKYGRIMGCDYFAPSPVEVQGTHSRYVWYGIHGFEPIMTVMGRGIESVRTVVADGTDIVVLKWKDGRVATLRATDERHEYGGYAHPAKGTSVCLGGYEGYEKLLKRILDFFRSGEVPVPNEETLELFAAMEAAERSRRTGGAEVFLSDLP